MSQYLDKYMDDFTPDTMRTLLENSAKPCVSFYMPTVRKGAETQQNSIRLKNLLAEARKKLKEMDPDTDEHPAFLQPVEALVDQSNFWQQQSDGLAIFVAPDYYEMYRLPLSFDEVVMVDELFYLKPLLPLLSSTGTFYLLTLNQGGISFWRGTRFGINSIELGDDIPKSLEEALQYDDFETHLQFHTQTGVSNRTSTRGGERAAIHHGHGASGDEAENREHIMRFFRALDNGVRDLLEGDDHPPLVLAGIPSLIGLYRQANHYNELVEEGVEQDPETLSTAELHDRAWQLVETKFRQAEQDASDYYLHLRGNEDERANDSIETIVSAAYFQRVDTLFVSDTTPVWGRFNADENQVQVHSEHQPGDRDLVNFAAVHTYLNGGTIYTKPELASLTNAAVMSATLRY